MEHSEASKTIFRPESAGMFEEFSSATNWIGPTIITKEIALRSCRKRLKICFKFAVLFTLKFLLIFIFLSIYFLGANF